jgi:CRP-like cAMP-binding protein
MRTGNHVGLKSGAELEQSVAAHPFFRGFDPKRLKDVVHGAREARFDEGQVLFREREPASHFYLIEEGEVALESRLGSDRALVIQTIGPGDVLGWSWLVAPYQWHFTARALKATKTITIDGAHLLVACEKDPGLGYDLLKRILKIVLERLQATRKRVAEATARAG